MRNKRKIPAFSEKRIQKRVKASPVDLPVGRALEALRKRFRELGRPVTVREIRDAAEILAQDWPAVARQLLDQGLAAKNDASEWTPASGPGESFASLLTQTPDWPLFTILKPRTLGMSAARLRGVLKTLEKDAGVRAIPLPGQRGAWAATRQPMDDDAPAHGHASPEKPAAKGERLDSLLTPGVRFVIRTLAGGPMRAADLTKRAAAAGVERPTTASGSFAAMIRAGLVVPLPSHARRQRSGRPVSEHVQWALSADGLAAAAALAAAPGQTDGKDAPFRPKSNENAAAAA